MPADGAGNAALIIGTIEDRDGCMVLQPSIGEPQEGAEPDRLVFEDTDERPESYQVGGVVELSGGGGLSTQDDGWKVPRFWHVPEACDAAVELWTVAPEGF